MQEVRQVYQGVANPQALDAFLSIIHPNSNSSAEILTAALCGLLILSSRSSTAADMLYKLVRQGYVQLRVLNIKDAGDRLRFRAACFLALMKYAGQPWKPPKIMPQHSEPLQKMLRDAGTDTDQIDAIADLASQTDQVEEIGRLASQTMGDYTTLAKAVLQRLSQGASGSEPSTPKAF